MVGGQTSNGVNFSVSGMTVSVSPASSNLTLNQSASFHRTVLMIHQTEGSVGPLAEVAAQVLPAGTLSNITSNSVTYTAPGFPPSGTVLLSARSVSDTTKAGLAPLQYLSP